MTPSLIAMLLSGAAGADANAAQLVIHPAPPPPAFYARLNDDFTVRVRTPGGPWRDLYEYNVKVDLDRPQDATMVTFDMAGPIEVQVRKNNGDVRRVAVRPGSKRITAKLAGNIATFRLNRPEKISVEFDGDRLHNLHILANAIETARPDRNDPNVIWYGPGVHELPAGEKAFRIPSNKTLYLEGGALLRGPVVIDKAENVKVLGRGIVDQPDRGFEVIYSKNVTIDGPIVANPKHYTVFCGQSAGLVVRNLKTFSADKWSDGLDFMSCSDVIVDDVFLRTSDDSIAIYGHRWNFYGDARNVLVTNATLWADVAHPINIGLHGDAEKSAAGEVIENLLFRNIDILEHDEDDPNYQGAMAINPSDRNLVRNVLFDDIRVDDFQEGQLVNLRVVYNPKYSAAPGRGIENILFRNISYTGANDHVSVIAGYDDARRVREVRFENLRINGRKILDAAEANIDIGEHADNVRFHP